MFSAVRSHSSHNVWLISWVSFYSDVCPLCCLSPVMKLSCVNVRNVHCVQGVRWDLSNKHGHVYCCLWLQTVFLACVPWPCLCGLLSVFCTAFIIWDLLYCCLTLWSCVCMFVPLIFEFVSCDCVVSLLEHFQNIRSAHLSLIFNYRYVALDKYFDWIIIFHNFFKFLLFFA